MYLQAVKESDEEVYNYLKKELNRQQNNIELIASENFTSKAVLEAASSVLTNKYAEGLPKKRYYGGCDFVDEIEQLAIERAKKLFKVGHANVQPHSGAQANMAVMLATLKPGDTIMGMDLSSGGHLTHGSPVNFSGLYFNAISYGVDTNTGLIDYQQVFDLAREHKPKLIICGASAYPRIIDFVKFKDIADKVGAYLMADIAHIAGLIATDLHPSPVGYADFITTTTHKTLRGPRGGIILCDEKYSKIIDKAVFPGMQGGPLMHIIAAKAVALKEALEPSYVHYMKNVVANAKALADQLKKNDLALVSGGTDNHLLNVDLRSIDMTGKQASGLLEEIQITVNKNAIPNDPQSPFVTSGIRLGTPAVTTRGFTESDIREVADIISERLKNPHASQDIMNRLKSHVKQLCIKNPLYQELICNSSVMI